MEKEMLHSGEAVEIEILEFRSGGNSYGISVNDIKEILTYNKNTTLIPNSHPYIEGIIMPRDFIITILDFRKCLDLKDTDEVKNEMIIVTGINNLNIAIKVDRVSGIRRKLNTDIIKPGKKLSTSQKALIIGIVNDQDKKIEMIDLRKLITNINPEINVG